MIMKIGIVAGDIWHYLDENGRTKLKDLVKALDHSEEMILMGLGWLAREGHVVIDKGDNYMITLRK